MLLNEKKIPNMLNQIPDWLTDEFQVNYLPGEKKEVIARDNGSKVLDSVQVTQLAKKINSWLTKYQELQADKNHEKSSRLVAERALDDAKSTYAKKVEEMELLLENIIETIAKSTVNPSLVDKIQQVSETTLQRSDIVDRKWKIWDPILPPIATEIGAIIHTGNSLISHKGAGIQFTRNKLKFKDLIVGWNNQHKSFDSARIFAGNGLTSVALCDGASEGGISSQLISRIFSSLISEKFAISNGALRILFSDNMLINFVDKQCFSKTKDGVAYLSRLTRQWPIDSVRKEKSDGYKSGKTTVVNFIVLDNGLCWYRYVGDSYLFLIRNGSIKQLTTNQISQSDASIEAIGLLSNASPPEANIIYLQTNDTLITCSDLLGENILKNERIGLSLGDLVNENPRILNNQIDKINSLFSKTDESDDISFVTYKYKGRGFNPKSVQFKNKPEQQDIEVYLDGERFNKTIGKYFYQSRKVNPKGFKCIDKKTAAILSQFRASHDIDFPKFIPKFDIFSDSNNNYYIVMDHLYSPKYERLDNVMKSLKTQDEALSVIEIIKNLELEFENWSISHSDISPSNIFIDRDSNTAKVIDLDTLCWSVSIPNEDECGHIGMYGLEPYNSNLASIYSHRLPFRIIEFTLYLVSTIFLKGKSVRDVIEWSSAEIYILTPEEIFECFKDGNDQTIIGVINRLKRDFPGADESKIRNYINSLNIHSIYNFI